MKKTFLNLFIIIYLTSNAQISHYHFKTIETKYEANPTIMDGEFICNIFPEKKEINIKNKILCTECKTKTYVLVDSINFNYHYNKDTLINNKIGKMFYVKEILAGAGVGDDIEVDSKIILIDGILLHFNNYQYEQYTQIKKQISSDFNLPSNRRLHENDLSKEKLKGKIISIIESYFRDERKRDQFSKIEYDYNKKGNLNIVTSYSINDNRILSKKIYKYDKRDIKTELYKYSSNEIIEKNIYYYDEDGNNTKVEQYESKNLVNTIKYKYDESGNIIAEESIMGRVVYKYDNKNNQIEINSVGNHPYLYTYTYDDKGNIIEKNDHQNYGRNSITLYEYEFDDIGNWITMTEYHNGSISIVLERKINYFDNNSQLTYKKDDNSSITNVNKVGNKSIAVIEQYIIKGDKPPLDDIETKYNQSGIRFIVWNVPLIKSYEYSNQILNNLGYELINSDYKKKVTYRNCTKNIIIDIGEVQGKLSITMTWVSETLRNQTKLMFCK